jgi:tRNA-dihydrouridine synthase
MTRSKELLDNQKYLLEFCQEAGILEEFVVLIDLNTAQSNLAAVELLKHNEFSKELTNKIYTQEKRTVIIGNGDVMNREQGIEKAQESGADGIMIGRGIFKNPWAFLPSEVSEVVDTRVNRLEMLIEHLENWITTWSTQKHFPAMKKFVKMYINNFEGAKDLRMELMEMNNPDQMLNKLKLELLSLDKKD